MSRKEALSQFINQIHGRPVVVKLNSGVDYRGKNKNIITLEQLTVIVANEIDSVETEHLSFYHCHRYQFHLIQFKIGLPII